MNVELKVYPVPTYTGWKWNIYTRFDIVYHQDKKTALKFLIKKGPTCYNYSGDTYTHRLGWGMSACSKLCYLRVNKLSAILWYRAIVQIFLIADMWLTIRIRRLTNG